MMPNWSGDKRRKATAYNGRMAFTISDEMSVRQLVMPSSQTVRLMETDAVESFARA
jgi:hypothetical protein